MPHNGSSVATQAAPETLCAIADQLNAGVRSSREIIEATLRAIDCRSGDARRIYPHGPDATALVQADAADALRRGGAAPALAGIPVSIKDNIAQTGQAVAAGTTFMTGDEPASADAPVVSRLRDAGVVIIGRTGMTELAFSGLGLNPHYGTPVNPAAPGCVPGGSSAGAAASVASGLAAVAIGTDTSGSCRIPAAFCNLVGFKPTAHRIPIKGVFPLSTSLDSVGIIGRSVSCCASVEAVLADGPREPVEIPTTLRIADLSPALEAGTASEVASDYADAIARLRASGVVVEPIRAEILAKIARINHAGGFGSVELFRHLQTRLAKAAGAIDPRVLRRILKGEAVTGPVYQAMQRDRSALIEWADMVFEGFDAVAMPTVAILPPRLDELQRDEDYDRINLLALRNAGIANMLDRCAVSIPCSKPGALPTGFTLMGRHDGDVELLAIARMLEGVIRGTGLAVRAQSNREVPA